MLVSRRVSGVGDFLIGYGCAGNAMDRSPASSPLPLRSLRWAVMTCRSRRMKGRAEARAKVGEQNDDERSGQFAYEFTPGSPATIQR